MFFIHCAMIYDLIFMNFFWSFRLTPVHCPIHTSFHPPALVTQLSVAYGQLILLARCPFPSGNRRDQTPSQLAVS